MISKNEAQIELNLKRCDESIIYMNEYKGDKVKHSFKCLKCNYVWMSLPNTLKRKNNNGCPNCFERKKVNKQKIRTEENIKPLSEDAFKLKNNHNTLNFTMPINIINALKDITSEINFMKKNLEELKKEELNIRKLIDESCPKWNWFLKIILLPIWIIENNKYSKDMLPYNLKIRNINNEVFGLILNIEALKRKKDNLEVIKSYYENFLKLSNRINLKLGGNTCLYYIKLIYMNKYYYKIGITINSVEKRYEKSNGKLSSSIQKIIFQIPLENAREIERLILITYKDKLANNNEILKKYGGHTEVFNEDVLNLDNYLAMK